MTTDVKTEIKPNELQQKCIDSINGKYLVLAGPGTGKTFTVVKRIENMVKNKNINPEEILCLTYTDSAANEMRVRIDKELGQVSSNINIYTYHSFCCEVIEEFRDEFELPANYRIMTDGISRAFIKECIDEINPKAYRTQKNDPYYYIQEIKDRISDIKANRLTKEAYFYNLENNKDWKPVLEECQDKLKELKEKEPENFKKISKLQGDIETIEKKIAKAEELWTFYEKYQEKMYKNHYLDFNDMISFVLGKFETDTSFLSTVANKYKYVLVDEYQDTNISQNSIVLHLTRASEEQNIFVVGDDDQIIYTFQGAKLDTLEKFLTEFPDTEVICLKENMRSTQSILDTARQVALQEENRLEFNKKFEKYNINKELIAKNEKVTKLDKQVRFTKYADDMQEQNSIVEEIDKLIKSDDCPKDKYGNKKLSEIAILCSSNSELNTYVDLLHAKNIPCELKKGVNIFANHAVNVLISYVQALLDPETYAYKIYQLLLSQPFSINAIDYQKIRENISKYKSAIDSIRAVKDEGLVEPFKIKNFIKTYDHLKGYITSESIKNSILEIGAKTSIFDYYMNFEINRTENIACLKKLVEEASAFSEIYRTSLLEEFVQYLETLMNDDIVIETDKAPVTFNAVQLSTYHSAKGKEYEYVYLPNLVNRNWESSSQSYASKIPLAPSEYKDSEELKQLKRSDKIKLLYVGMTRAKHFLALSYPDMVNKKVKKVTALVANIKDYMENVIAEGYDENSFWEEAKKTLEICDYDYKKDFAELINGYLNQVKYFSPSSMNVYLSCPRQYLYAKVFDFDVKDGNPDFANFGTAIHEACEKFVEYSMKNKEYPSKEVFIKAFKDKLAKLPLSNYQNRENLEGRGENALDKFYSFMISTPIDEFDSLEQGIEYEEKGFNFYGKFDRVDKNKDGSYTLYDYKTGSAKTLKEVCPEGEKENYYNQMALYKYIYEKTTGRKVSRTVFVFPEDHENNLEMNYTEAEIDEVLTKYKNAVDSIRSMDFEPTFKKDACKYCAYKDFCNSKVV